MIFNDSLRLMGPGSWTGHPADECPRGQCEAPRCGDQAH